MAATLVSETPALPLTIRLPARATALRRISEGCGLLLILLAVTVIAGWALDLDALKTVLPHRVSMKANTAFGFLTCGLALLGVIQQTRQSLMWARVLAAFALSLGVLTIAEFTFSVQLHIDELLFSDPVQIINPGRPSMITSIAFTLASLSLLLLSGSRHDRRLSLAPTLLLTGVSFASMIGYIYGVPVLYGSFSNVNSMALHTGVGFLILALGLVLANAESTIVSVLCAPETGGWLARRFLPAVLVLPVLLGFLYLRPAVNFGQLRFGMALFAVTLVAGGALVLVFVAKFLNTTQRNAEALNLRAEEAARVIELSERELRMVTDHLPTLLSYMDLDGHLLRVNRTYEEWLGRPSDQIVGRSIRELLGEAYWTATRPAREHARRGVTTSVETPYPTVNGDRRAVVTYAPDLGPEGEVRGLACMVVDVEDRRRAEAALLQSEKLAAVGRLSASIAHEINNPVDAVMNLIYLAREQSSDEDLRHLLALADKELKRVANITSQTLRFHKQGAQPEPVLATDLFDSVLALHEGRIRNAAVAIDRRDRATVSVECFEGEIRQVISNLVANAVDATLPGGRLLLRSRNAFDLATRRHGIRLTIADTGSGMNPATLARVFEAFFTTKGIGGTGLGLWVTTEILTRHHSRLQIRTSTASAHHGTVFSLFLPQETVA